MARSLEDILKDVKEIASKGEKLASDAAVERRGRLGGIADGQVQRAHMDIVRLYDEVSVAYSVVGLVIDLVEQLAWERGAAAGVTPQLTLRLSKVEEDLAGIKDAAKRRETAARDSGMFG